jgi:hypothetical protein
MPWVALAAVRTWCFEVSKFVVAQHKVNDHWAVRVIDVFKQVKLSHVLTFKLLREMCHGWKRQVVQSSPLL